MYLNTRIFPTTGYARVLLFMFIRRELGGTGTGCLFQFTYCEMALLDLIQWTKVKRYFGRVYYNFTLFGFKNAKINFLKKKSFRVQFYRIEVQVITNPSCQLEKISNTWIFAYDRFFLWIF